MSTNTYFRHLATVSCFAFLALGSGCAGLIGLDDYKKAEDGSAGASSTGGTSSGGSNSGGSSSGGSSNAECSRNIDCNDGIGCTVDKCEGGTCQFTPNHSLCSDSGDVCLPNRCDAELGCTIVDASSTDELIVNGNMDAVDPAPWVEVEGDLSTPLDLIYGPGASSPTPRSGSLYAWFGDDTDLVGGLLYQTFLIPEGAQTLTVEYYFFLGSMGVGTSDEKDWGSAFLWDEDSDVKVGSNLWNWDGSDEVTSWTKRSFEVDVTSYVGKNISLNFYAEMDGDADYTNLYIDDVSVVVTTCQ